MNKKQIINRLQLEQISDNFYKSSCSDFFFFGTKGVTITSTTCVTLKLEELQIEESAHLIELSDKCNYIVLRKEVTK